MLIMIITDVITYTAADMLTWGNENGMSIALDEEDSSLAVINSEKLTTWVVYSQIVVLH